MRRVQLWDRLWGFAACIAKAATTPPPCRRSPKARARSKRACPCASVWEGLLNARFKEAFVLLECLPTHDALHFLSHMAYATKYCIAAHEP